MTMATNTYLEVAKIRNVIIIDDAYEEFPLATDLAADADAWGQFFEDLQESDVDIIKENFPTYDSISGLDLRNNNEFVACLWQAANQIRPELINPLFARFKDDKLQDLSYLETLAHSLRELGLSCTTCGKDFSDKVGNADLIIIDLYLGSTQSEQDLETSIKGLSKVIQTRLQNPPLVILMSRSSRLEEKKKQFRDKSGLFESAFRIIKKTDLAENGKLERLLTRLAIHCQDSKKLAAFLNAWRQGLENASERTASLIRTLDLADHAQIKRLLLDEDGTSVGGYIVDVFDLVLQHEIERESPIINAALELNDMSDDLYPPPYVADAPDWPSIIFRCIFQNRERLKLGNSLQYPVVFGDVLRRKKLPPEGATTATELPLKDIGEHDVLAIMTPACDLQRADGAKNILLLKGTLLALNSVTWPHKCGPALTVSFETNEGDKFKIDWNLKHIETISITEISQILEAQNGFDVIARMRESHALELQQKLLSTLGRVGNLSPLPGTFPITIGAYLPDTDGRLKKLDVPSLALSHTAGCYIGRKEKGKRVEMLLLSEDACDEICEAVKSVDLNTVHLTTHVAVQKLQTTNKLLALESGVDIAAVKNDEFKLFDFGYMRWEADWMDKPIIDNNILKNAGIVLVLSAMK